MKAFVLKRELEGPASILFGREEAATYHLDPPMVKPNGETAEYVYVSASSVFGLGETFIFEADAEGTVGNMSELPGSRRGRVSPDDLMREIGYEVVEEREAQP